MPIHNWLGIVVALHLAWNLGFASPIAILLIATGLFAVHSCLAVGVARSGAETRAEGTS